MPPSTKNGPDEREDDFRRAHEHNLKVEQEEEYAKRRSAYQLARGLKRLRDSWGISQEKMAELMGVSQRSYSGYENGERSVPSEALVELAVKTSVDLNELFTGDKARVGPDYNQSIAKKTLEIFNLVKRLVPNRPEEEQLKLVLQFMRVYDPSENEVVLSDVQFISLLIQSDEEEKMRSWPDEE